MLLVLSDILIEQIHKIPDIEGHEAAFFLDGKRKLFAVGFHFSFQILGENDIKSPLPQRVGQPLWISSSRNITPATIYVKVVIPAKAGI